MEHDLSLMVETLPIAINCEWQFRLLLFAFLRQVLSIALWSRTTASFVFGWKCATHNIIIAQHYNATQSGKVSPTNANWNLIAFQWKLMLQKMFATWRPQRNNLLQFIFPPTFLLTKRSQRVFQLCTIFFFALENSKLPYDKWRRRRRQRLFHFMLYKPIANIDESFKMNEQIANVNERTNRKGGRKRLW